MILLGFDIDEQSQNEAENSVKSLKDMATKALGAIGVAFSVAGAASFVKDCVSVASEVEEMQNKFDVVFQGMTDEVEAWAQSYSDAIGRNKNDIKTYLADQQNLLVGFGMTRQEGAELSKQMTTLALDLASFANLDETAAVNNMTKAVMGESEAAKALGAVLNDDTRARAMQAMGLSGTYEKLDQLTKMQVNYNAILAQSPDAIGDCERSLGSYKSTVVQFQSKLKEIKTLVGQFFMPTFQKVISFGAKGLTVLRDGVQKLNDFAAKIGGAEKIIGVLGVTIGATLAIVNFQKISNGLKLIGKGLSNVNLKVFAIAAVVLMLALIVQDFIAFMNGDNSVIGALFEKAGIDADEARATIQKAWSTIKDFLLSIWGTLQGAAQAIFGALSDWWAENGEAVKETLLGIWKAIVGAAKQIFGALSGWWKENGAQVMETFSKLWEGIKQLCETLWNALVSAAQTIFGALKAFWDTWGSTIIAVFSILWNTLISLIQPFLDFLSAVIDFLANVFTGNWEGAWNAIKDMAAAAWEMLVTILGGAWDTITTIWGAVIDFFAGIFQGVWDVIVEKVTGIKDAIVNGFQAAIDWITALPEQALKWGSDIVDNIVNGITGAVGKVGEAVKGVADKIKSFLGFSEPEDGPLSDFHTYMPDMIDLMTQGIAAGKERVRNAVEEIAAGMSDGMNLEDNSGSVTGMVGNLLGGIKAAKTKANEMLGSMKDDGMTFNPKIAPVSDLGNFVQGIAAGKEKLKSFLQGFSGDLSFMTQANVVQPETVSKVGGGNDSKTVSITQNVNIDNQFNGDRAGQEKSSEAMDKAADDSTSEMARALQFARG
jgi:phage-related protein